MLSVKPYDRVQAVSYAQKWALDRNPEFYDFSDLGGDCTNFISQCIYAGARQMNVTPTFGWYYRSPANRSPSWSGVPYLYQFLLTNQGTGPFAKVIPLSDVALGDVIQLGDLEGNFYHSLLVTSCAAGKILVATHSYDALDRPLTSYSFQRFRCLHINGVRS